MRPNTVSTALENLENSPPVRGDICDELLPDGLKIMSNGEFDAMEVLRPGFADLAEYGVDNQSRFVLSLFGNDLSFIFDDGEE